MGKARFLAAIFLFCFLPSGSYGQVITDVSKEVSPEARKAAVSFLKDWLVKGKIDKMKTSFDLDYLSGDEHFVYYGFDKNEIWYKLKEILGPYRVASIEEVDYERPMSEPENKAIYELFSVEDELEAGLSGIKSYIYAEAMIIQKDIIFKFVLTMYEKDNKWKVFNYFQFSSQTRAS